MTTLQLIDLTCPVCTTQFRSQAVLATNGFGGKRTDFHERAAGMQPLPYFVHLCTTCGYAGVDRDFDADVELLPETRERVWFELPASLKREGPRGSLKYEHAARVAEWQGCEPRYLGDLYLRAAWCAVDEQDHEAESIVRPRASMAAGWFPRSAAPSCWCWWLRFLGRSGLRSGEVSLRLRPLRTAVSSRTG